MSCQDCAAARAALEAVRAALVEHDRADGPEDWLTVRAVRAALGAADDAVSPERDQFEGWYLTVRGHAERAEARLAAVEALCADVLQGSDGFHNARFGCETAGESDVLIDYATEVLAAARGEGEGLCPVHRRGDPGWWDCPNLHARGEGDR